VRGENKKGIRTENARILLIEDNRSNRLLLGDYLEMCGYQVCGIESGILFRQWMEVFRPDLIILDIKLPGIDGYEILRQIVEEPVWSKIPVIIVSALAFTADQQRGIRLGARQYLVKPVRLNELKQAIEEELKQEKV
jgi:two-component system, cell cycle response regulator DivK